MNIHMADAFNRAQVVADPTKMPWARIGDIIQVKPLPKLNGAGRIPANNSNGSMVGDEALLGLSSAMASGSLNTERPIAGSSGPGTGKHVKGKAKGNYLFRLKAPSEEDKGRRTGQSNVNHPALSISETVAHVFGLTNRSEVQVSAVKEEDVEADYIELYFTGQYLGRADMWRLGMSLEDRCVYVREKVEFAGIIRAEIRHIYRKGKKVASGLVTARTKTIYRSKSAQSYIFLQLCREMWESDEDGERYYEKALHGFLPELFQRWKDNQANHVVTIILFARVLYDESEVAYLKTLGEAGTEALMHDKHTGHYKDFYKVLVDFETRPEWLSVMPILKQQMIQTHEEILLNHHLDENESANAKILGRLSYAFEGNVLECLNFVLNPFDENYIDRDLSRTGLSIAIITPGAGHFQVNKDLLRLTTERMLDQGICLDLVCLTQVPLHISPLFSFWSQSPKSLSAGVNRASDKTKMPDILYYDPMPGEMGEEKLHYSLAFWVYCHFYSRTHDRPFREDRFVPRCKMYDIQMLGVMDHDLTTLALPLLELPRGPNAPMAFDEDTFASTRGEETPDSRGSELNLRRIPSRGSGSDVSLRNGSYRSQRFVPRRLEATVVESEREPAEVESSLVFGKSPLDGGRPRVLSLISSATSGPNNDRLAPPVEALPETFVASRSRSPTLTKSDKTMSRTSTITAQDETVARSTRSPSVSSQHPSIRTKTSIGKGSSFLSKFFGRALPSEPTAAVTIVHRHDVSISSSPTSAKAQRHRRSDLPPSPVKEPEPSRPPVKMTINDLAPPAIAIPIRGKPADSKRKHEPKKQRDSLPENVDLTDSRQRQPIRHSPVPNEFSRSAPSLKGESWPGDNSYKRQIPEMTESEINPCRPMERKVDKTGQAQRWRNALPRPTFQQDVKWDSLCAPACLPLTNGLIPGEEDLISNYREQVYVFDCHANQLSFLIRPDVRDLPIAVMREMASQRLSQNFQFIVGNTTHLKTGRVQGIVPGGASEVLRSTRGPLWLSTPNQVHSIDFCIENRNTLEVHNYTRKITYNNSPIAYKCLVFPRQRKGYQPAKAMFRYPSRANDFNYLDRLISGAEDELTDAVRYWRTRFILIPSDKPPPAMIASTGEALTVEEIMIVGASRLLETIGRNRWHPANDKKPVLPPKLIPTWLDPSACVTDPNLMEELDRLQKGQSQVVARPEKRMEIKDMTLPVIASAMKDPLTGLQINDRWWHKIMYADSFQGDFFVTWLMTHYTDIKTREAATEWGNKLQKQGLIEHCDRAHGFLDGYYFYRLTDGYARSLRRKRGLGGFFAKAIADDSQKKELQQSGLPAPASKSKRKSKITMSQTMILDLDLAHRSDRAEVAILHSDVIHNPANAFHFELNWMGVTAGLLDDIRQRWSGVAEKHGLRLVEAPVEQIKDVGEKCAYRACFPIKLALQPPAISDLDERLPEAIRTANFFEYAILRQRFGFVLDVEATNRYPDNIEVEYSYRQAAVFDYSQFVHRSGVALVQCIGGEEGFLWSDNRLFFSASSRYRSEKYVNIDGQNLTRQQQADMIRQELQAFCADPKALEEFYESVLPPLFLPEEIMEAKLERQIQTQSSILGGTVNDDFTGPYGL